MCLKALRESNPNLSQSSVFKQQAYRVDEGFCNETLEVPLDLPLHSSHDFDQRLSRDKVLGLRGSVVDVDHPQVLLMPSRCSW